MLILVNNKLTSTDSGSDHLPWMFSGIILAKNVVYLKPNTLYSSLKSEYLIILMFSETMHEFGWQQVILSYILREQDSDNDAAVYQCCSVGAACACCGGRTGGQVSPSWRDSSVSVQDQGTFHPSQVTRRMSGLACSKGPSIRSCYNTDWWTRVYNNCI